MEMLNAMLKSGEDGDADVRTTDRLALHIWSTKTSNKTVIHESLGIGDIYDEQKC